jgi:uncharacterized protein YlxP (DUF503 family)
VAITTIISKEDRTLPCTLNESELVQRGGALAILLQDIAAAEEREKSRRSDEKGKIGAMKDKAALLRDIVANGSEPRQVGVQVIGYHDSQTVSTVRMDTGEILGTRAMTMKERQMPFDFIDAPADAPKAEGEDGTPSAE